MQKRIDNLRAQSFSIHTPNRLNMDFRNRLFIIVAVELAYMVGSRMAIQYFSSASVEAELIRTVLRILTAAIYWQLMKPLILSKTPDFSKVCDASLVSGLLLLLSIPVLVGDYGLTAPVALLFAATSVVVAIKEEFLFRGIVQNLLEKKLGELRSVLLTSAIFTVWHIGAWEPSLWVFSQIFFASIILGLIYIRTGSIFFVIVLHTVYDAVFSFTPLLPAPLGQNWGLIPLIASASLIVYWALSVRGAQRTAHSE